jgi:hypothetical protein
MTVVPSDEPAEIRAEIAHLRNLSTLTTDGRVLAELASLIQELKRRLHYGGP